MLIPLFLFLQSALRLLEIPRELSCSGSLLRCHVTLLLVDVTCVSGVGGVNDAEMVKVCQGLVGMLKQQVYVSKCILSLTNSIPL